MPNKSKKGFTLLELLIVIAVIAILAAITYVALNPAQRFKDSRDARRWADSAAILNAIKVHQVDYKGVYLTAIQTPCSNNAKVYMIYDTNAPADATSQNANCETDVTGASDSVNLAGLVSAGYIGSVPISPNGSGTWVSTLTGYTLQCSSTGAITIRACEKEGSSEVKLIR